MKSDTAGRCAREKDHHSLTGSSNDVGAAPLVTLCHPQSSRANRLCSVLGEALPIVQEPDLESLARSCRDQTTRILVLPVEWPESPSSHDLRADTALLRFIREHRQRFAIIVYADTTQLPVGVYCRALCAGARRIFNEAAPTFPEDLCRHLQQLVRDHQAQCEEEKKLTGIFENFGLIGQSPGLREVFRRAIRASHFSDLPVLILGETGTGKQRLAEAIHRLDVKRGQKPFLTVNCSAISKTLAESELFGHVKGAFSGAGSEREGHFRAANEGTLFLDEIGELDRELQPKLLRVLQERRLLPVGADYEHAVDLRVIAATNRTLEQMVAAGQFRDDLYQRLNVFRIQIPPLRERTEDIYVQARHLLRIHQQSSDRPVLDLAPGVREALRTLPWEGNTRQLENLIRETLAFKEEGTLIHLEDLPVWALEKLAGHSQPRGGPAHEPWEEKTLPLPKALAAYERRLLQSLLAKHGGNRTRTAAELGLTPRTLYNKLKKHGLGLDATES